MVGKPNKWPSNPHFPPNVVSLSGKRLINISSQQPIAKQTDILWLQPNIDLGEVGVQGDPARIGWDCSLDSPWLWQDFPNKQEYSFLRGQLNSLADDPHELSYCYVGWNQELPLVNVLDLWVWGFLDNNWNTLWILCSNLRCFSLSLIYM